MGELYECVLFTASLAKYADPVADLLDKWVELILNFNLIELTFSDWIISGGMYLEPDYLGNPAFIIEGITLKI